MIDLRQMRQYVAVAETLNFRRAAERLNMAQPPLSAAIRRIEEDLGVVLLERDNRSTRLTAAGSLFLLEARRTLAQAERACSAARQAAAGLTGSLRIGCVDSQVGGLLPRLLRHYRAHHPSVDIQLLEATPPEQLELLGQDRLDAGVLVLPVADAGDIQFDPLFEDRLVVALPLGHHLAERPTLNLADCAAEPWILFAPHDGPGMYARIMLGCAEAGFVPRVAQHSRQMQTTAGLVAAGLGIALMPRQYARRHAAELAWRELEGVGAPLPYALALAYREPSPCVQALREEAQALLAPSPEPDQIDATTTHPSECAGRSKASR